MPGLPIKPAVLTEIQRQLNHEWSAAHAYTALAVWCAERNLKGFAQFFHKQSGEEREHAQKFMDHLLDRGAMPELLAIPAPMTKFKSVLEAAQYARQMEQANTTGIHRPMRPRSRPRTTRRRSRCNGSSPSRSKKRRGPMNWSGASRRPTARVACRRWTAIWRIS